jgi:hypothetical protein
MGRWGCELIYDIIRGLCVETKKTHENPQSWYPVSRPRCESETPKQERVFTTDQGGQAVTILICIREVPVRISAGTLIILIYFRGFPQSLQANVGIVP